MIFLKLKKRNLYRKITAKLICGRCYRVSLFFFFFLLKNNTLFGATTVYPQQYKNDELIRPQKYESSMVRPQKYGTEGRFKSLLYHTNGVYYYEGYYMHPTYIEFAADEKINTIYMPKAEAWSVKQNGNRLFLTPVGDDANTKMTVMTNKRTYFFELHAKEADGPFDPNVAFFVKFRYPASATNKTSGGSSSDDGSIIQYIVNKGPDLSKAENFNFNYTVSGDYVITPIKIFDDGQFTYFEFRDKNGIIPAIFSVDSEGFESIVNFRVVNQYLAVEGVNSVYTLRHGTETVCVFNETMRGLVKSLTTKK